MTKVGDYKDLINAIPDDFFMLWEAENGSTNYVSLDIDTKNKCVKFKKA